jgi:hypothetical protein
MYSALVAPVRVRMRVCASANSPGRKSNGVSALQAREINQVSAKLPNTEEGAMQNNANKAGEANTANNANNADKATRQTGQTDK